MTLIFLGMLAGSVLTMAGLWLAVNAPTRVDLRYVWWSPRNIADIARLTLQRARELTRTVKPDGSDDETVKLPDLGGQR